VKEKKIKWLVFANYMVQKSPPFVDGFPPYFARQEMISQLGNAFSACFLAALSNSLQLLNACSAGKSICQVRFSFAFSQLSMTMLNEQKHFSLVFIIFHHYFILS